MEHLDDQAGRVVEEAKVGFEGVEVGGGNGGGAPEEGVVVGEEGEEDSEEEGCR